MRHTPIEIAGTIYFNLLWTSGSPSYCGFAATSCASSSLLEAPFTYLGVVSVAFVPCGARSGEVSVADLSLLLSTIPGVLILIGMLMRIVNEETSSASQKLVMYVHWQISDQSSKLQRPEGSTKITSCRGEVAI